MKITEDIRRYRGDWLIEAYTAFLRGQTPWTRLDGKPLGIDAPYPGMYNHDLKLWDPLAGPTRGFTPALHAQVRVPQETDIGYPGENIWITPTWTRTIKAHLHLANAWNALRDYARGDDSRSVAYYHPRHGRVVWGLHQQSMRTACLVVSDETPYQPIKGTEHIEAMT